MQRYDTCEITATKTDEGFIKDTPIVGRTGLLRYFNADGTERIEYRPPEEAFNADSLASLRGKPITVGHKAMVTAGNAASVQPVGSVISGGQQDGDNIRADIIIYSLGTAARELSCGYRLDLDETPGTTPTGQHYDAVQRNIRYNHLAIVPKGRAGVARLNMDGEQELDFLEERKENEETMLDKMTKIRLDGGLEYDAAPEVGVAFEKLKADAAKLRQDIADRTKEYDQLQAKYDASLADNEKLKADAAKAAEEAKANFDAAVKSRVSLLAVAAKHKVANADGLTDKEIKLAVIKAVRGDKLSLDGKSDDYIDAAFDMAKDEAAGREDAMAAQRKDVGTPAQETGQERGDEDDPETAMRKLLAHEANLYMKEDK